MRIISTAPSEQPTSSVLTFLRCSIMHRQMTEHLFLILSIVQIYNDSRMDPTFMPTGHPSFNPVNDPTQSIRNSTSTPTARRISIKISPFTTELKEDRVSIQNVTKTVSNEEHTTSKINNLAFYILISIGSVLLCILLIGCILWHWYCRKLLSNSNENQHKPRLHNVASISGNIHDIKPQESSNENVEEKQSLQKGNNDSIENIDDENDQREIGKTPRIFIHSDEFEESEQSKESMVMQTTINNYDHECGETPQKDRDNVNCNHVKEWLNNIVERPEYYTNFVENGYESLEIIREIKHKSDLKDIGIQNVAHQDKILQCIYKLNQENVTVQ